LTLIYQDQLNEEAKAKYWDTHCAAGSTQERNGGAHLAYLAHMVGKFGKDGFAVGSKLSIADFMLFDIMDMHVRIFEDKVTSEYPDLGKHHAKVAALPRVAAYLSSDRRPQKQNGNGLG